MNDTVVSKSKVISINFREARRDPSQRQWDLPPWGHPAASMVMPLFIVSEDRLTPVGTAFLVGGSSGFVMSAAHNVTEAIKNDGRYDREVSLGTLSGNMSLRNTGLSVMHHFVTESGAGRMRILPLSSVQGAPPTDVVVSHVDLPLGTPVFAMPVSFIIPTRGETVWSLGYCDFKYPKGGIPMSAVRDGSFDWSRDYGHRFLVAEAQVEASFSSRLCSYVDGPCFAFNELIPHGLSGGPVISQDGRLIGVNSASVEMFFDRPMSAATLLYPLALTSVKFSKNVGPLTISGRKRLVDLIMDGLIRSDGSEDQIAFKIEEDGMTSITVRAPTGITTVYEDFTGYRSGTPARKLSGNRYIFRRVTIECDRGDPIGKD